MLPDGYTIETCPAAENWWREAAGILERGKLMTIDYGLTAEELFSPDRLRGTLRAYFRHHASDDILANVGEQDLTAHVNFSAIQAAGESVGLRTEMFSTQSQFLTRILEKASKDDSFGEWNIDPGAPVSNPHASGTSGPRLPGAGAIKVEARHRVERWSWVDA